MHTNQQPTATAIGRHEIIREVRALMPRRALEPHEARGLAERQALKLLALLGLDQAPVDLDAIAGLPRLEVKRRAGLPVSGFSEWVGSKWLIVVKSDEPTGRQRFTLAHELKHVLDNPFIDGLYPDEKGLPSGERAEAICDYFAGCLLMPRPWLKSAWSQGFQRPKDLAGLFGVSQQAVAVRLLQTGLSAPVRRCRQAPIRPAWRPSGSNPLRRYSRALSFDWSTEFAPSFASVAAPGWAP